MWPLFGRLPTFAAVFEFFENCIFAFWSKKVGKWPLLKMDLATKNPVFMRVCGVFGQKPTFILK